MTTGPIRGRADWLEGGRRARRSGARYSGRDRNNQGSDFQPVHDRHNSDDWRLRGNDGADSGTDRANVRGGRGGSQVGAIVELRAEEDNPEEQSQNSDIASLGLHVGTKT